MALTTQAQSSGIGKQGENAAYAHLVNQGFEIVARNWRCGYGETDIIAREGKVLVFVEVRTRKDVLGSGEAYKTPVSAKKKERLLKLSRIFAKNYQSDYEEVRFDVIAIKVYQPDRAFLYHVRNVFKNHNN
jgi:putative endonuclease